MKAKSKNSKFDLLQAKMLVVTVLTFGLGAFYFIYYDYRKRMRIYDHLNQAFEIEGEKTKILIATESHRRNNFKLFPWNYCGYLVGQPGKELAVLMQSIHSPHEVPLVHSVGSMSPYSDLIHLGIHKWAKMTFDKYDYYATPDFGLLNLKKRKSLINLAESV